MSTGAVTPQAQANIERTHEMLARINRQIMRTVTDAAVAIIANDPDLTDVEAFQMAYDTVLAALQAEQPNWVLAGNADD